MPGSLSPEVEACFALAADELRGERSGLAKLNDAELQRRLQRQVMRDAGRPGVQAMLACILRKTAS